MTKPKTSQHGERAKLLAHAARSASPGNPRRRLRARSLHKTSLRQDIWTVLRFRSSIPHSSGLQFASYLLELCILVLILLNVVLAISESATVLDASKPGTCSCVCRSCGKRIRVEDADADL